METRSGSEAMYRVVVEKDVSMRARDDVTLYANVYRLNANGRFPALVQQTISHDRRYPSHLVHLVIPR